MTCGKLEARITVPTGGWSFDFTDDSGEFTVTIPAGTYYHSTADSTANSFVEELQAQIDAAKLGSEVWSVALDAGENGTGKYTIGCSGAVCELSLDGDYGYLLGMYGAQSGATSYTGTSQAQALWLPSQGWQKLNGGIGGGWVTDKQDKINSSGNVFSVMGQRYRKTAIRWATELRSKCWAENETVTNESFEQFLIDGIWGIAAWGTSAGPIRWYPDADVATSSAWSVPGMKEWEPTEFQELWSGGYWRVDLPLLVQVSDSEVIATDAYDLITEAGLTLITEASVTLVTEAAA